ncbi:MAG: hypothetical protein Rhirs2KO_12640 [Rhizobiaceae bacterium]
MSELNEIRVDDLGRMMSVDDVCDFLGISRQAVYQARRKGEFAPEIRLTARRVAFPEKLFLDWLASRQRPARMAPVA